MKKYGDNWLVKLIKSNNFNWLRYYLWGIIHINANVHCVYHRRQKIFGLCKIFLHILFRYWIKLIKLIILLNQLKMFIYHNNIQIFLFNLFYFDKEIHKFFYNNGTFFFLQIKVPLPFFKKTNILFIQTCQSLETIAQFQAAKPWIKIIMVSNKLCTRQYLVHKIIVLSASNQKYLYLNVNSVPSHFEFCHQLFLFCISVFDAYCNL